MARAREAFAEDVVAEVNRLAEEQRSTGDGTRAEPLDWRGCTTICAPKHGTWHGACGPVWSWKSPPNASSTEPSRRRGWRSV